MFESFLSHRSMRWLRWSLVLVLIALVGYVVQDLPVPRNGGTVVGYTLGTIAALLMIWLTWLGRRKRNYRSSFGTVKGWTSAHVYLGAALIVVATLHTGFQFGANVHTLAFILMMLVCVSGIYGVWAYSRYPFKINENSKGKMRAALFEELKEEDRQIIRLVGQADQEVDKVVRGALERTEVGTRYFDQLMGKDRSRVQLPDKGLCDNPDMRAVADYLVRVLETCDNPSEAEVLQRLLTLMGRRARLLSRIREDVRLAELLRIWLIIHIPFAFAALAAVAIHVVTVFIYW